MNPFLNRKEEFEKYQTLRATLRRVIKNMHLKNEKLLKKWNQERREIRKLCNHTDETGKESIVKTNTGDFRCALCQSSVSPF